MKRVLTGVLAVFATALLILSQHAWLQGKAASRALIVEARHLMTTGQGGDDLGEVRLRAVLSRVDPDLMHHVGIAWGSHQSIAERLAHIEAEPLIPAFKTIQYSLFALAIDQEIPKMAQVALFLNRVEVQTPVGQRVKGLFATSRLTYGRPVDQLVESEFLSLLAGIEGTMTMPNPQDVSIRPSLNATMILQ